MKILIIEDESAIQTILKTYLEEAGYEIALADDGFAGVSKFRAGAFSKKMRLSNLILGDKLSKTSQAILCHHLIIPQDAKKAYG